MTGASRGAFRGARRAGASATFAVDAGAAVSDTRRVRSGRPPGETRWERIAGLSTYHVAGPLGGVEPAAKPVEPGVSPRYGQHVVRELLQREVDRLGVVLALGHVELPRERPG